MSGKVSDHQVRVFVSNGSVAHFTLREMHRLYTTWQFWVLVLVGFFIMSTGHPVTMPQFDSFGVRMAFWLLGLAFYLLLSTHYVILADRVWRGLIGGPIPLLVLSTPLFMLVTHAACAVLTLLFEPDQGLFSAMTWQMNLRNIVVAHVFETAALLWLLPAQRARSAKANGQRKVTLAGRSFVLGDIGRVKAAEHHLEIHGETGVEIIRERMATFLEQVTLEDGIQTHRSHWVAVRQASNIKGDNLRLSCGEKVPVARGRQDAVRAWLQDHARFGETA